MEFSEIYKRQGARVYRVAMLYLKNVHDAEDAVQNIFIRFLEKEITFDSAAHENAWFITTTKNYCKDVLKSSWKRKTSLGDIQELAAGDSEDGELLIDVYKLPEKYREVLYLYYYEEYSVREISKLLCRKESTIQTQLAAARKKLKSKMESEGMTYGEK